MNLILSWKTTLCLAVGFVFLPLSVYASRCDTPPLYFNLERWKTLPKYEGDYENYSWGYAVTIPEGLTGQSDPLPNPQHGIRIILSLDPWAIIWVEGWANSLEWETLEQAANYDLKYIKKDALNIVSIQTSQMKLADASAVRYIVRYQCPGGMKVEDFVVCIDERTIVYTIRLTTYAKHYDTYKPVLDQLIESFRFIERQ